MAGVSERDGPLPTERALLQGLAVARWAVWAWMAITTFVQRHELVHPVVAATLVVGAWGWTLICTVAVRQRPAALLTHRAVAFELVLAWVLLVADGWVFAAGVGSGRYVGALVNGVDRWPGDRLVSLGTTVFFYAVGAGMWGLVTRRLRIVEGEVAMRRARDEVARTLHDGVLQTLALVARRSALTDPELAAVARRSDRELRAWLFHGDLSAGRANGATNDADGVDLATGLRRVAERVSREFDIETTVSVLASDDDEPVGRRPASLAPDVTRALLAAAGEALRNAAKHSGARRVVVFAEIEDGVAFASVRDDGRGFDPTAPTDRVGIARSIRDRMDEVGGRAEIASTPGSGTEVRLWSR